MLQAIGGPVAAGMIPVMKSMTAEFNEMGAAAIAHGADISHFMDAIMEPIKGLANTLAVIGPPIAKTAQEFADLANAIVAFENKISSTMRGFWKSLGIDYDLKGPIDFDAKTTGQLHRPVTPTPARAWSPSGVALGGGADNAKLAAASAMPVSLPPPQVHISAPAVSVGSPKIEVSIDGKSIVGALKSDLESWAQGAFARVIGSIGAGATSGVSGFDGRQHPIYPDSVSGVGHE